MICCYCKALFGCLGKRFRAGFVSSAQFFQFVDCIPPVLLYDCCIILYRRVAKAHPPLLSTLGSDPNPLLSFVAQKHLPLLIEVHSLPVDFLKTRNKTSASPEV